MQSCCDSDEHLLEQDFVAPDRKTKRALKHDICTTSKLGLSWAAHKGLTSISTVRLLCYLLLSPELQDGYNELCLRAFRTRCGLQCIGAVLLMDRREMRLWPRGSDTYTSRSSASVVARPSLDTAIANSRAFRGISDWNTGIKHGHVLVFDQMECSKVHLIS